MGMSTKQKSGGAVKGWGILRRGTPRPSDGAQGAPYCDEILSEEGNIYDLTRAPPAAARCLVSGRRPGCAYTHLSESYPN